MGRSRQSSGLYLADASQIPRYFYRIPGKSINIHMEANVDLSWHRELLILKRIKLMWNNGELQKAKQPVTWM